MDANKVTVIPTLILAAGSEALKVAREYENQYEKKTFSKNGLAIREFEYLQDIKTYLIGPYPQDVTEIYEQVRNDQFNKTISEGWRSEEAAISILLFADFIWLNNVSSSNIRINLDVDRYMTLIVYEDREQFFDDKQFDALFDWVADQPFINNVWWIDSQTPEAGLSSQKRKEQALLLMDCLTRGLDANLLLDSEYIHTRKSSDTESQIIGSFHIKEYEFGRDRIINAVVSLLTDDLLFPLDVKPDLETGKHDQTELAFLKPETILKLTEDEVNEKIGHAVKQVIKLTKRFDKLDRIKALTKALDEAATAMESPYDIDTIMQKRDDYIRTIEKYWVAPPKEKPRKDDKIEPKSNFWFYIIISVLLLIIAFLVIRLYNPEIFTLGFADMWYAVSPLLVLMSQPMDRLKSKDEKEDSQNDKQEFEERPTDKRSFQLIVSLRIYQDFLERYSRSLFDYQKKHVPRNLQNLKNLIDDLGVIRKIEHQIGLQSNQKDKWLDTFGNMVSSYSGLEDLYIKWLDSVCENLNKDPVKSHKITEIIVNELLKQENKKINERSLMWRKDKSECPIRCIITTDIDFEDSELDEYVNVNVERNDLGGTVRVIHFGQFFEGRHDIGESFE